MIYLQEEFFDHDKVSLAGGDATWLYLCVLAYLKGRRSTDGLIVKAKAHELSDRKNKPRLCARLVEVRLFEDRGTHYKLHDYEEHNERSIRAAAKATAAAQAKWEKAAKGDCSGDAPSSPPSSTGVEPQAAVNGCPSSSRSPLGEESSSSSQGVGDEPEEEPATPDEPRTREALGEILARRRLKTRRGTKEIGNQDDWLESVGRNWLKKHGDAAMALWEARPELTAKQVVAAIESGSTSALRVVQPVELEVPDPEGAADARAAARERFKNRGA